MIKLSKFDPRDRQILYDFWDKLPKMKFVKDAEKVYYAHPARILILKTLGEGLPENQTIRRALNVQEILQRIQIYKEQERAIEGVDWKGFDISIHNLYFHIQKLEEAGLIQTVAILREGRHNVSYYGRVAQVLIFRVDYEEYDKIKNAFAAMAKIAPLADNPFETEKIQKFYKKYVLIGQGHTKHLFDILTDYQSVFEKTDVDPGDVLNFIELLFTVNSDFIELIEEMKNYLGIRTE